MPSTCSSRRRSALWVESASLRIPAEWSAAPEPFRSLTQQNLQNPHALDDSWMFLSIEILKLNYKLKTLICECTYLFSKQWRVWGLRTSRSWRLLMFRQSRWCQKGEWWKMVTRLQWKDETIQAGNSKIYAQITMLNLNMLNVVE